MVVLISSQKASKNAGAAIIQDYFPIVNSKIAVI
jgi:hypothetical protein